MKKFVLIIALLSAVLAIILATLPVYKLAFIPGISSISLCILSIYWSKSHLKRRKTAELGILLSVIALILSTYKIIFTKSELGNTKDLEQKEVKSQEEAIEELESLDIELPDSLDLTSE